MIRAEATVLVGVRARLRHPGPGSWLGVVRELTPHMPMAEAGVLLLPDCFSKFRHVGPARSEVLISCACAVCHRAYSAVDLATNRPVFAEMSPLPLFVQGGGSSSPPYTIWGQAFFTSCRVFGNLPPPTTANNQRAVAASA